MKLNTVKRLALSGLLAASVTGGTLVPFVAGHASASASGGHAAVIDDEGRSTASHDDRICWRKASGKWVCELV